MSKPQFTIDFTKTSKHEKIQSEQTLLFVDSTVTIEPMSSTIVNVHTRSKHPTREMKEITGVSSHKNDDPLCCTNRTISTMRKGRTVLVLSNITNETVTVQKNTYVGIFEQVDTNNYDFYNWDLLDEEKPTEKPDSDQQHGVRAGPETDTRTNSESEEHSSSASSANDSLSAQLQRDIVDGSHASTPAGLQNHGTLHSTATDAEVSTVRDTADIASPHKTTITATLTTNHTSTTTTTTSQGAADYETKSKPSHKYEKFGEVTICALCGRADPSEDVKIAADGLPEVLDRSNFKRLSAKRREALTNTLRENIGAFTPNYGQPGEAIDCVFPIDTGNHPPFNEKLRPSGPKQRAALKKELEKMLAFDIIRPEMGPWSSNCLMVPKRDGTFRMVVDLRKLNAITTPISSL